jgi:hypothetical protein
MRAYGIDAARKPKGSVDQAAVATVVLFVARYPDGGDGGHTPVSLVHLYNASVMSDMNSIPKSE